TPRRMLERLMILASGKETGEKVWVEKTPMDLEHLSGQQKRIVELLSAHPMPAAEIAKALTTSQSGVRGQLNRLSSMDFLREKGYRMPIVEKREGVWQIHPEFMVAYNKAKQ
ncbi:MAG: winged helix-turn-helix domain-containing protein, partial [Candidatus Thermoplasmatota archaeon]|nr:winged helix-turn-helix domain-containing protein [Candidatus Thermoplasmatota archaeon]